MNKELSIPRGKTQKLFLEYLNSELNKHMDSVQGSHYVDDEGFFINKMQTKFREKNGQAALDWIIRISSAGVLENVVISSTDLVDDETQGEWVSIVNDIFQSTLCRAFMQQRKKFFRRRIFYYFGQQLDGEYWLAGARLAPIIISDFDLPIVLSMERVVALDFYVDAIDDNDAIYLASEFSRRWAARFSLLLDVDFYECPSEQVWVTNFDTRQSMRINRGYSDGPYPNEMPRKGECCKLGNYAPLTNLRFSTELLQMPSEARRFFRKLECLPTPVQDAFDGAARLYQIGLSLNKRFPSAALAYRVAAIDALQQVEKGCKGFSQFMRKYLSSEQQDEEVFEFLYSKIRSAHFHAGIFDLGEFSIQRFMDIFQDQDAAKKTYMRFKGREATRQALLNWILKILES